MKRIQTIGLVLLVLFLLDPMLSWANNTLPPEKEKKLLQLEAQVAGLEQKAFALKQKIKEINDKIFKKKFDRGKPRLSIFHTNKMASYFHIIEITYWLVQGTRRRKLISKKTTVKQKMPNTWRVFQGNVPAGQYTLEVTAKIRGYNPILTYINSYKITLKNRLPLTAVPGHLTAVKVEFLDTGGKDVSKRLSIRFQVSR